MRRATTVTRSQEYSGEVTLEGDSTRSAFRLTMIDSGTVEFGKGGGLLPLPAGGTLEPLICPNGHIAIKSTGSFILGWSGQVEPEEAPWSYLFTGAEEVDIAPFRDSPTFAVEYEFASTQALNHAFIGGPQSSNLVVRMTTASSERIWVTLPTATNYEATSWDTGINLLDGVIRKFRVVRKSLTEVELFIDDVSYGTNTYTSVSGESFNPVHTIRIAAPPAGNFGARIVGLVRNVKVTTEHETRDIPISDGWAKHPVIANVLQNDVEAWDVGDVVADGTLSAPTGNLAVGDENLLVLDAQYRIHFDYNLVSGNAQLTIGNVGASATSGPSTGKASAFVKATALTPFRMRQLAAFSEGSMTNIHVEQTTGGIAEGFTEGNWRRLGDITDIGGLT